MERTKHGKTKDLLINQNISAQRSSMVEVVSGLGLAWLLLEQNFLDDVTHDGRRRMNSEVYKTFCFTIY